MKLLKLIAVLLDYPKDELWTHGDELREAVNDPVLSAARRASLLAFVDTLLASDTLDAQERWLALFDRGRAMSLLLFEHIHGESRDRGQAMVDLLATYRKAGFEIGAKQLPDYLPLVLEYLSLRPVEEVRDWLGHVGHILELLAARAQERNSPYAALLEALVELATGRVELELLRRRVATEERDDTPQAMDKVWEEEAVRFGVEAPGEDCNPPTRLPSGAKRIEPTVMP
ncbi:MAG: nitrate reductase molybdenum cofactor assembly chaperone [Pseudomonadota bacterium]|jgi:nitrate reductase delta subunit